MWNTAPLSKLNHGLNVKSDDDDMELTAQQIHRSQSPSLHNKHLHIPRPPLHTHLQGEHHTLSLGQHSINQHLRHVLPT
jgi:hypothetical protein